ncbi:conserved Plasmodium protein, unknown function [Plasmodium chabaudi chabaudi]|uniref:Uncharacterized protein n=1 Tax=Plasmodium chabaudi chabaudi TaxID=31271 RepID=A0A1C6XMM0_PLACU|nr:conserved Plasmodium protein, unknown function [Plasmodium chabaudi chabaudi]
MWKSGNFIFIKHVASRSLNTAVQFMSIRVDCNANPRHKQVLSNPAPRSRGIPKYLEKYIFYKQAVRNPVYKSQFITMYTAGRKYRQQIKKTA